MAINLRQKIFGADFGFVKKREAKLLSCWLVCFDGRGKKNSREPNYRADANGFNNTEDLNEVKQHIGTRGKVLQRSNSKSNGESN